MPTVYATTRNPWKLEPLERRNIICTPLIPETLHHTLHFSLPASLVAQVSPKETYIACSARGLKNSAYFGNAQLNPRNVSHFHFKKIK